MKKKEKETQNGATVRDDLSNLKPPIDDLNDQNEEPYVGNFLSNFQSNPTINKNGITILLRWLNEYVKKLSLSFLSSKGYKKINLS